MIEKLFEYYMQNPFELPGEYYNISETDGIERAVCDYIAGMSDTYCVRIFNQLFIPKFWIE